MATTSKDNAAMAAIGSYDLVMPFQAVGMETTVIGPDDKGSVPHVIAKYARGNYAILFMEESLFAEFKQDVDAVNENERLSVIPIPNQSGLLGVGIESIRLSAERAVGMDIFGEK